MQEHINPETCRMAAWSASANSPALSKPLPNVYKFGKNLQPKFMVALKSFASLRLRPIHVKNHSTNQRCPVRSLSAMTRSIVASAASISLASTSASASWFRA